MKLNEGIEKVVESIKDSLPKGEWDFPGIYYFDGGPLSVQYFLVLHSLNFCFWPDEELSYDHLALGLKRALEHDKTAFDADHLQRYTGPELREMLKWPRPLPLEDERVRLLNEVGRQLEINFQGKASNLVKCSEKSALKLVHLITCHFPDYIVPAVLRQLGVLKYSSSLAIIIESKAVMASGSEEEVELRACSIYAVEKMRDFIHLKSGNQVLSLELDFWLWSFGVRYTCLPHHRTLSIYY